MVPKAAWDSFARNSRVSNARQDSLDGAPRPEHIEEMRNEVELPLGETRGEVGVKVRRAGDASGGWGESPQTPRFFLTTAIETQQTPLSRAKQGVRFVGRCVGSRFVLEDGCG